MFEASYVAAAVGLVNLVGTLGGGFYFLGRVTERMKAHDIKTDSIEKDVRDLKLLLVSTAVDNVRIQHLEADVMNVEKDVRDLRRGVGWINDAGASSVDREYGKG